jgi:signal transduction histidine kinase
MVTEVARGTREATTLQEEGVSIVAIPVLGDAIFVTARGGDRPFSQEEQQVITNFAYEIGIAADNARLLEAQQEALQVKDQFLSIVSHELRTPLTTIKGYAQMLRRKVEDDPQSVRFADHIDSQVSRLSRLVDDLLDVTRFSRGEFELMPEDMDLRPVLEGVIARFRVVTPRHALRLELDGGPLEGYWDPDRLEQVMNNLVSNAIKYSPDGGDVVVSSRHEDGHLLITVRDQGVGISPQDQQQLFERFYRGSAEGQEVKGLGLGLYVTRRIVEAHGGAVGVRSQPGKGSEFYFTLPLVGQPAVQKVAR